MNKELDKVYDPQKYEDSIYKKWEESGFFNPDVCVEKKVCKKDAKAFSIVLPPPNVTGHLHIGHAVMLALQDIMVRYHRMKGDKTLWVPGTDHAAIATQSKVEKLLWDEEKKTRHDLGREEFLKRVEEFAQESHDVIINQSKKMGSSMDWSREVYTLDEQRNLAVRTAFKKMYNEGLIYRGHRIVNWDPKLQTTVSDDELERVEERAPFYYLQYGPFVISTARPETKFGDKYVVMHPKDDRYAEYKNGQEIELEWINGKIKATVIKDEAVDMNFGTGVMTITPWHDMVDFEIAEHHNLDKEQIIDYDGKLMDVAGEFKGLDIKEGRKKIVAKLKEKGLLVKVEENYIHNIAINSRGGGIIEPQIKEQWFIGVNKEFKRNGKKVTLKKLMQDAVRSKKIDIIPERFEKTYFHWIDNLRDWCISRQIWFGHQIPVYYCNESKVKSQKSKVNDKCLEPIVSIDEINKCPNCGGEVTQDSDTLDTWFSSGLWTFSPLGWPNKTKDLKTYHPISVMETGYDILFFWVARMILMTTYLMDDVPFKKVYLHGLVRDEKGKKMSKSLGNVIDPLDVIKKYGTDAVRLSLVIGSTPGNDVKLSEQKIASYRNFTNKLWNVARYIITNYELRITNYDIKDNGCTLADIWILNKMEILIKEVTNDIEEFKFSQAGEKLRDFTWNELADWYLEVAKFEKTKSKNNILNLILRDLLKLWHPFMPFVTETVWHEINSEQMLIVAPWPLTKNYKVKNETDFNFIISIIKIIRNIRAEYKIIPSKKIKAVIYAGKNVELIESQKNLIENLRTNTEINIKEKGEAMKLSAYAVINNIEIYIPLEGLVDVKQESDRLQKRAIELKRLSDGLDKKLSNTEFVRHAPKEIVEAEIKKQEDYKSELKKIKEQIKHLK